MNVKERLLSERDPEQEGIWTILGEYENPDIFGSERPLLEVVKGRYKDAVDFALTHPRFFTWGSGGVIRRGSRKGRTPKVLASKSLFEDLKHKVDMEGLDYIGFLPDTFIKAIQDPKFHQLYSAYIEASEDLKTYIHEKAKNST